MGSGNYVLSFKMHGAISKLPKEKKNEIEPLEK